MAAEYPLMEKLATIDCRRLAGLSSRGRTARIQGEPGGLAFARLRRALGIYSPRQVPSELCIVTLRQVMAARPDRSPSVMVISCDPRRFSAFLMSRSATALSRVLVTSLPGTSPS